MVVLDRTCCLADNEPEVILFRRRGSIDDVLVSEGATEHEW